MLHPRFRLALLLLAALALPMGPVAADDETLAGESVTREQLQRTEQAVFAVLPACESALVNVQCPGGGEGSGVIVNADGLVLTAAHVSGEPGQKIELLQTDGTRLEAITLGLNHLTDSGMIRITSPKPAGGWPFRPMREGAAPVTGDWVMALGHPEGFDPRRPVVLRVGRIVNASSARLQSDCELIGGDSGGPLFDLEGRVVGIHSCISNHVKANFSIPMPVFRRNWARFLAGETVEKTEGKKLLRAGLDCPLKAGAKGAAVVGELAADAPAAKAGWRPGDVVVAVDGDACATWTDLQQILLDGRAGDEHTVEVRRDGQPVKIPVKLVTADAAPSLGAVWQMPPSAALPLLEAPDPDPADQAFVATVQRGTLGVAMGTVVNLPGGGVGVLTKGENIGADPAKPILQPGLRVRLADNALRKVVSLQLDRDTDLALLRLESEDGLVPVALADPKTELLQMGHWVASPGGNGSTVLGVLSAAARGIRDSRAVLGVTLEDAPGGGVSVRSARQNYGAHKAGIRSGDVLLAIDGHPLAATKDVQLALANKWDGDEVKVLRRALGATAPEELTVRLGKHRGEINQRLEAMEKGTGDRSRRRSDFSMVLQHDSVIKPRACGAPLMSLDGELLGINIARGSRVASYALPVSEVRAALDRLVKLPPVRELPGAKPGE